MKDQIIYSFQKNTKEEICASITEKEGKSKINLGVYCKDENDEYKPSKKVITLSSDLLFELELAIHKLKEEINQKKLF